MILVIVANTISMLFESPFPSLLELFFTVVYVLEAAAKMLASGFWAYLANAENLFDFCIMLTAVACQIALYIVNLESDTYDTRIVNLIVSMRFIRIMKLYRFVPILQRLSSVVYSSLPELVPLSILLFLFIYVFGIIGHYCFPTGSLLADEDSAASFDTLSGSMLAVFQVITGEQWLELMEKSMFTEVFHIEMVYFLVIHLGGNFLGLTLLLSIIMANLDYERKFSSNLVFDAGIPDKILLIKTYPTQGVASPQTRQLFFGAEQRDCGDHIEVEFLALISSSNVQNF
jgi:hypothetical protein